MLRGALMQGVICRLLQGWIARVAMGMNLAVIFEPSLPVLL